MFIYYIFQTLKKRPYLC